MLSGSVVTYKAFKTYGPSNLRSGISRNEYVNLISNLQDKGAGQIEEVRVQGSTSDNVCFIKVESLPNTNDFSNIDREKYRRKRNGKIIKNISPQTINELRTRGYIIGE